jgi:hypothetical protein
LEKSQSSLWPFPAIWGFFFDFIQWHSEGWLLFRGGQF